MKVNDGAVIENGMLRVADSSSKDGRFESEIRLLAGGGSDDPPASSAFDRNGLRRRAIADSRILASVWKELSVRKFVINHINTYKSPGCSIASFSSQVRYFVDRSSIRTNSKHV